MISEELRYEKWLASHQLCDDVDVWKMFMCVIISWHRIKKIKMRRGMEKRWDNEIN